jgi:hypothetical protein
LDNFMFRFLFPGAENGGRLGAGAVVRNALSEKRPLISRTESYFVPGAFRS